MVISHHKKLIFAAKRLNRVSTISAIGDFTAIFVYGSIFVELLGSPISAAIAVAIKSIGVLVGSVIFLKCLSSANFDRRRFLIATQVLLGALTVFSAAAFSLKIGDFHLVAAIWFFQSVAAHLFALCRESYSKVVEDNCPTGPSDTSGDRRSLYHVVQVELGPMIGQAVGPLCFLAIVELFKLPIVVPLYVDAVSFFLAALLSIRLPHMAVPLKHSVPNGEQWSLIRYVMPVFLTRVVVFASALAIFNAVIFDLIPKSFGLSVSYVGLVYSLIGIASTAMGVFVGKFPFSSRSIFCTGSVLCGAGALLLGTTHAVSLGILGCLCVGVGNAGQRIGSRGFLRSMLLRSEYDEVIAIDGLAMKLVEAAVITLTVLAVNSTNSSTIAVWSCFFLMIVLVPLSFFWTRRGNAEAISVTISS